MTNQPISEQAPLVAHVLGRKEAERGFYGTLLSHSANAMGALYDLVNDARAIAPVEHRERLDQIVTQLGEAIYWLDCERP